MRSNSFEQIRSRSQAVSQRGSREAEPGLGVMPMDMHVSCNRYFHHIMFGLKSVQKSSSMLVDTSAIDALKKTNQISFSDAVISAALKDKGGDSIY